MQDHLQEMMLHFFRGYTFNVQGRMASTLKLSNFLLLDSTTTSAASPVLIASYLLSKLDATSVPQSIAHCKDTA